MEGPDCLLLIDMVLSSLPFLTPPPKMKKNKNKSKNLLSSFVPSVLSHPGSTSLITVSLFGRTGYYF